LHIFRLDRAEIQLLVATFASHPFKRRKSTVTYLDFARLAVKQIEDFLMAGYWQAGSL
jgi:hypothetical protein